MSAPHVLQHILAVVGLLITGVGLFLAYAGSLRRARGERMRTQLTQALGQWRTYHQRWLDAAPLSEDEKQAEKDAVDARTDPMYAEHDLQRIDYSSLNYQGEYAVQRIFVTLLEDARSNLIVAGCGLLIAIGAEIWAIFV